MRWRDILFLLVITALIGIILTLVVQKQSLQGKSETIALIDIEGTITSTSRPLQATITPDKVRSLTKEAVSQGAQGIIYRINSGGGTVVTSKDVYRTIKDSSVPSVCLMKDYAASGAYWASLGCDKIIADPLTITGSIGAKSSYLEFSGLLNELGVEYVNLTSGQYKEMGTPLRNITDQERDMIVNQLNEVSDRFLATIKAERNLSQDVKQEIRQGSIILGEKAEKLNLVDQLGSRQEAKQSIKQLIGAERVEIMRIEQEKGLTDLLSRLFVSLGHGIGQTLEQGQGSKLRVKYG